MMPAIPVFIIALEGSDRLAALRNSLDKMGIPATNVDALDGRRLTSADIETLANVRAGSLLYGERLSGTQVGCVVSHRRAYECFLSTGALWALVLEDDAFPRPELIEVLARVGRLCDSEPTIVECFSEGRVNVSPQIIGSGADFSFQRLTTFPGFTVGYLINRAAASHALDYEGPVASRADWPAWASDVTFWRTVPNVVLHGSPDALTVSTMEFNPSGEKTLSKGVRWLLLLTGINYLRLRRHYPDGPLQFYKHAVMPTARYWMGRLRAPFGDSPT